MMIALPSVAVDEPAPAISRALERSRGNGWRLYFGSVLCWAPFFALGMVMEFLAVGYAARERAQFFDVLVRYGELMGIVSWVFWLVYVIQTAVLVAYYSLAFRELRGVTVAPESPQPQELPAQ